MSLTVYVLFPTANIPRAKKAIDMWEDMGYRALVYSNEPTDINARNVLHGNYYGGYWWACNLLAFEAFEERKTDLVVLAADDMDPDPNKPAEKIASEYFARFPGGEGIMQPTGDRQGEIIGGKWASQRICGSPWFGLGWYKAKRFNGKPTPEECFHFFGDEILYNVSRDLDLLEQRDDLCQHHHHWSFERDVKREAYQERNSKNHWHKDHKTFCEFMERWEKEKSGTMA